ncbi:hypothetical protein K1W54_35940 [Micromonospora sp. CPCC 205371]|nr:hypothetical protein [Micromonospora sp. CPCC 205371]
MRRFLAVVAALAVGGLTLVGLASPASAHNPPHLISITGNMHILDDDNWPETDDVGDRSFNIQTSVGSTAPSATVSAQGCVDDEVRVVVSYRVDDNNTFPGWVFVTPSYRLFEGASCSTTDLDGTLNPAGFWVGPNQIVSRASVRVNNTAEGGDWADITVTVRNTTTV